MKGLNSIILIGIAGVLFFLFGKPMLGEISSLNGKKADYARAIEDVQNIENLKSQLSARLESIPEADRAKLETFLPDAPGIVDLISEIDAIGAKYGISIANIETGQLAKSSGTIETVPGSETYKSMYLGFGFKTSYEKLKSFITELESSLRIMDVRSIDIVKGDKGIYDYKVTVEIYWLPQAEEENI